MNNIFYTARLSFICILTLFFMTENIAAQTSSSAMNTITTTPEQSTDPSGLIHIAIEDVLSTLRDNETLFHDNPQKLQKLIEDIALPYLNITRMAQLSLGKNWKDADSKQRATITQEFQIYLLRTYTKTLFLYRHTKPEILSRDDNGSDKTTIKVRVKDEIGKSIILFIRLENTQNQWKIVDVNVEGVSLVVTARGLFNDEISKKGLDGFIQSLTEQNQKASLHGYE